jgi:ribosomal protein S21
LLEIKKKENERFERLLRRFNRTVQQSGLLTMARKRRFKEPEPNKRARRISAIRKRKIQELRRKRREGY